jgi:hypothetical protein
MGFTLSMIDHGHVHSQIPNLEWKKKHRMWLGKGKFGEDLPDEPVDGVPEILGQTIQLDYGW